MILLQAESTHKFDKIKERQGASVKTGYAYVRVPILP